MSVLDKLLYGKQEITHEILNTCYIHMTCLMVLLQEELMNSQQKLISYIDTMIQWTEANPIHSEFAQSSHFALYRLYASIHFLRVEIHLHPEEHTLSKRTLKKEIHHYHKGWTFWSNINSKYAGFSRLLTLKMMDYFYTITHFAVDANILIPLGLLYFKAAKSIFARYGNKMRVAEILAFKYPRRNSEKWTYYFIVAEHFFFKAATLRGYTLCDKYIKKGLKLMEKARKTDPQFELDEHMVSRIAQKWIVCFYHQNKYSKSDLDWYQDRIWSAIGYCMNLDVCWNTLTAALVGVARVKCKEERELRIARDPKCDDISRLLTSSNVGKRLIMNVILGKYCAFCAVKSVKLRVCAKCGKVRYCTRAHQKMDWKQRHRVSCTIDQ
eukprot:538803_1